MEQEEPKKDGRGGARAGAGRPKTGRKAVMTITLGCPEDIAAILAAQPNRSQYVFRAIRAYAASGGE